MKFEILKLIPLNLFLKFRIWVICKFLPYLLNNERTSYSREGYELSFHDDFDEFDKSIWQDLPYFGYRFHPGNIINNGTAPYQYHDPSCVSVKDSILRLECNDIPTIINYIDYDGKDYGTFEIPYQVGWIQTMPNTFQQKYGYFEIRSKSPDSGGTWPAFWLASTEAWPPEIDIFEIYTSDGQTRSTSTIHWGKDPKHPMTGFVHATLPLHLDFSVFGCDWNEKNIKIYYNGWLVRVFPTPNDFKYEMNIIINNGVQTDEMGANRESIVSPNYFEVDYVKVWKKQVDA
jgi:beta-glucanase (GH16 family)